MLGRIQGRNRFSQEWTDHCAAGERSNFFASRRWVAKVKWLATVIAGSCSLNCWRLACQATNSLCLSTESQKRLGAIHHDETARMEQEIQQMKSDHQKALESMQIEIESLRTSRTDLQVTVTWQSDYAAWRFRDNFSVSSIRTWRVSFWRGMLLSKNWKNCVKNSPMRRKLCFERTKKR